MHQYLPEHVGGTEIYTHGLARRAQAGGHQVVVLTYRESPEADPSRFSPHHRSHEGVPVVEIPYNLSIAPNVARYEYDNPFVGAEVRRTLERWRPDVAHATHGMKLSLSALEACRSLGIPLVVTLCDYWFLCPRHTLVTWEGRSCAGPKRWRQCFRCVQDLHGIAGRAPERRAIRERPTRTRAVLTGADHLIALSPFLVDVFARNNFDTRGIEVIPHGLETHMLGTPGDAPRAERAGPTRLLYVGSLVRDKGAHIVAEAVRRRPDLDVELVVHGALRQADRNVALLRRLAEADRRIVLAGVFPPAEMGRVLSAADYLVVPALWYENDPLVVKAANHVGLPVIASRIGSLERMIDEDVTGWLVPPGDVKAWEGILARAVADRGRTWPRRPGADMDEHFARVDAIYARVIEAKRVART